MGVGWVEHAYIGDIILCSRNEITIVEELCQTPQAKLFREKCHPGVGRVGSRDNAVEHIFCAVGS